MENREDEIVIDLHKLWDIFKKYWLMCVVILTLFGVAAATITIFFIQKSYTAAGKMIVVKQNDDGSSANLSYSDVQLSQKLVSTYSEIIKSELISDKVIRNLNLSFSNSEYNKMLSVGSVGSTEVIEIKISSLDPVLSAKMVNEIIEVFIGNIDGIMNVNNVSILNKAKTPTSASSPSLVKNVAVSIILGGLLSAAIIFLKLILDTNVKDEDELKQIFNLPIIGRIPTNGVDKKGTYSNDHK